MASLRKLEASAPEVARMLGALANKERIRILCRLAATAQQEAPIAVLAEGIGISLSALSQHLAKLRKAGIISVRRVGHNSFYQLVDPRSVQLANGLLYALKNALKAHDRAGAPNA